MMGFWDPQCPAKTGRTNVLATAYVKKDQTLISIASWAPKPVKLRLHVAAAKLGLDPTRMHLYAPPIAGFQPLARFQPDQAIPVQPGRGWLILVDEKSHGVVPSSAPNTKHDPSRPTVTRANKK